jgi:tRNA nucleotidyltransferase (CCA-adding enzyme)
MQATLFIMQDFIGVKYSHMPAISLRSYLNDERLLLPPRLHGLQRVAEQAARGGILAYAVGGFVRDLLLERAVNDFDIVIEGDAISFAKLLAKTYGGKVTAHKKFGTAKWWPDGDEPAAASFLDLITARSETYKSPAALPTVKFSALSDDILRRDFTINTLAMRLDGNHFGELRDDLNGRADLERGLIRVLHPGSFMDDPTRIYRAVRYEQRYGFEIEPDTLALIQDARPVIKKLSAQRIRHELDLMLEERTSMFMLARLVELDLLKPIHPALPADVPNYSKLYQPDMVEPELWGIATSLDGNGFFGPSPGMLWSLWLAPLSKAELESINDRLAFTADLMKSLLSASALLRSMDSLVGSRPSEWVSRLDDATLPAIAAAHLLSANVQVQEAIAAYLKTWRHIKPATTGADLKKRGLVPGPKYNEILSRLRAAWLDGEVQDNQQETNLLERLL